MPRVAPITGKSDVAAEHHDIVDGVLKVFGQIRGPFSMLLHSPELAEQMLGLGNFYAQCAVVACPRRCALDGGPLPLPGLLVARWYHSV